MMNSDIINNMEIVLQKKVEGKCNRIGFIDKVHGIELYEETINLAFRFTAFKPPRQKPCYSGSFRQ